MSQKIETKVCTKCGEEKILDMFYNSRLGRLGKNSRCKKCVNKVSVAYAKKNRDKINEKQRINRHENREEYNKKMREYRKNNPKVAEREKKYKQRNKEKVKKWDKEWRERNKDVVKKRSKKYYEKRKAEGKTLAWSRKYNKENRLKLNKNSRDWYNRNRDKILEKQRQINKENKKELTDHYIKQLLSKKRNKQDNIKYSEIPHWMVEEHRQYLKAYRKLKQLKNEVKKRS